MGKKILVVDDEIYFLNSIKRTLKKEKFEVLCAASAKDAFEVLKNEKIELVISDYRMAEMNGIEFLKEVFKQYPDTIRFMLTGETNMEIAMQAINEGAISRFFTKPCNIFELAITIDEVLKQKELMEHTKRLLDKAKQQSNLLKETKDNSLNISQVQRDKDGAIIMEKTEVDYEDFLKQISDFLDDK